MKRRVWQLAALGSMALHGAALWLPVPFSRSVEARSHRVDLRFRSSPPLPAEPQVLPNDPPQAPPPDEAEPTPEAVPADRQRTARAPASRRPAPRRGQAPDRRQPELPKSDRAEPQPGVRESPKGPRPGPEAVEGSDPKDADPARPAPPARREERSGSGAASELPDDLNLLPSGRPLAAPDPGPRTERRIRPPKGLEPSGGGTFRFRHRGFEAVVSRDGTVTFRGKGGVTVIEGALGMAFDSTTMLARLQGDDPHAADKIMFLKRTRRFRAELRRRSTNERLKRAVRQTKGRLAKIWEAPEPARLRRKKLFRIWDSCIESGTPEQERAGAQIRASVEAFVRRELPAGSPDAYAPEELAHLNAERHSRARFEPYR
ncbi:MAG TPA: hypothetical protein RMG48_07245 [Myxococcales bacterium LLY-WYZ-16_1]|nr:hypothetical protein [Myxococcales bacterium LLY-WYZ-16_1]